MNRDPARCRTRGPLLVGIVILVFVFVFVVVADVFVIVGIDVSAAAASAAPVIILIIVIVDRRDRPGGVEQQRRRAIASRSAAPERPTLRHVGCSR